MRKYAWTIAVGGAVIAAFGAGYALRPAPVPVCTAPEVKPAAMPYGLENLLVRCEEKMDRIYLMERAVAFRKYLDETSGGNEILKAGRARRFQQAMATLKPDDFMLFEALGKGAKIRLRSGVYPLTFGELCIAENSGKFRIAARLLPESCKRLSIFGSSAAILEWQTLGTKETPLYYLCLWDPFGDPAAMYQIGGAKQSPEMRNLTIAGNQDGMLVVNFAAAGKSYSQIFSLAPLKDDSEYLHSMFAGKRSILDDRDAGVVEPIFQRMLPLISAEDERRAEMCMEEKFKVLFADDELVSYEIRTYSYTGGAHGLGLRAVGTLRNGSQQTLTLADIAAKEDLPRLTALLRKEIVRQLQCRNYQEARKQLLEDVYPTDNFYYDEQGLHFIYNPYEITPYVFGQIDLCIKWPRP